MSRWVTLTVDQIKASAHGALVDSARTVAVGGIDPAQEAIDNAIARIRRAIAPGNVLDADPAKIPGSFKGVAEQLVIFALSARIGFPLSEDQRQAQRDITSDLNRVSDNKTKVELADNPEGTGSFAPTGMKAQAVNVPRRQTGRDRLSGL